MPQERGRRSERARRVRAWVPVLVTMAVLVALVIFGAHIASGPRLRTSADVAAQSGNATASATPTITVARALSPTATANDQTPTASPTATTPVPTPTPSAAPSSIVDGASSQATAAIQQFVSRNGALADLGQRAGDPFTDRETGVVGQYFSNAVLEYHPEFGGTQYAVELARVGVASADSTGLLDTAPFQPLPSSTRGDSNCWFVAETRHRLCAGFRAYWQTHGLDLGDSDVSYRESLALFGYPISEEFVDSSTGHIVQYFERARLEYDPTSPPDRRVFSSLPIDAVFERWHEHIVNGIPSLFGGG
jgi:hypothetical protein